MVFKKNNFSVSLYVRIRGEKLKKETLSKYIYYNCKDIVCQDGDGNVITGAKIDSEAYGHDEVLVVRFRDGLIDGDVFNDDGTFKMQLPAVYGKNHQEYWRKNKLHRDGGLPAVISGDPAQTEYWVNGVRQEPPEKSHEKEKVQINSSVKEA